MHYSTTISSRLIWEAGSPIIGRVHVSHTRGERWRAEDGMSWRHKWRVEEMLTQVRNVWAGGGVKENSKAKKIKEES